MNVAIFKEAQEAYARGDYEAALDGFIACARDTDDLAPSDLSKFYHLIGNCYVKSGDPYAASSAYSHALAGSPEKRKPSLYVNLGTALLGTKEYEEALVAFTRALDYPVYATPYKAYSGIGAAQLKLGNMAEAGAAYREAALDPANPDPAKALVNLGVCFMELGRSADAITSYETALEFDLAPAAAAKARANLGQAYMAEGRVRKALEAFEDAMADGSYELSPMARHDYEIALTLKDKLESRMPGILDTGFLPNLSMLDNDDSVEEPASMPLEDAEPEFDPFAPQTRPMEPVDMELLDAEPEPEIEPEPEHAAGVMGLAAAGATAAGAAVAGAAAEVAQAKPRSFSELAQGVDEDELERTLVELGIAPDADGFTGYSEEESSCDDGSIFVSELDPQPQPEEEAADEAATEHEDVDLFTAETAMMQPVVVEKEIDIPIGDYGQGEDAGQGLEAYAENEDAQDFDERELNDIAEENEAIESREGFDGGLEDYESEDRVPEWQEQYYDESYEQGGFVSDIADSGEPLGNLDITDTHMPSPEDTQFFALTEKEIVKEAKEGRRKARKSRGVGLKVAILIVILAIIVAAAGAAAYILGYGYPQQEDVARNFLSAAQKGESTSEYWADDVDEAMRAAQTAPVQNLTSYNVEAVKRDMAQTTVYVKGTLEEGGQADYEFIMVRDGLSWAVEYIELYFPSEQ